MDNTDKVLDFAFCSDLDFWDKYLKDLSLEEQTAFMEQFKDFMEEEAASGDLENVDFDAIYQKIMREIGSMDA